MAKQTAMRLPEDLAAQADADERAAARPSKAPLSLL